MKTRILKQTFVIALAMMVMLIIGSSVAFGQDKADKQSIDLFQEEQDSTLEGVWQSVITPSDCQTGAPAPVSFKTLETYMQGGTMSEDNNFMDGPFRTAAHGIWRHTSGRNYTIASILFHYAPNGTFIGSVKVRVNRTLGRNSNSATDNATSEVYDPNGNLVFTGCSTGTSTRFTF